MTGDRRDAENGTHFPEIGALKTADKLDRLTAKELGQMAKKQGVPGWHEMRKAELVKALVKQSKAKSRRKTSATKNGARAKTNGRATSNGRAKSGSATANGSMSRSKPRSRGVERKLKQVRVKLDRSKNLAFGASEEGDSSRDRLVLMVRDPFWLHAFWEISRQGVKRAEAAMGQEWHGAKPVLRLLNVSGSGMTTGTESLIRYIGIHGGVTNWYIDVDDPPNDYRVDIGYLSPNGKFFSLARSNVVSTPRPGSTDAIDENWTDVAENYERIYAQSGGNDETSTDSELQELFEERLRRPMNAPVITPLSPGVDGISQRRRSQFNFELDAELIVYGKTESGSAVTLLGDPVQLRGDGTFTVRFSMPNCRQVIPAVARSADGIEERTIVLAIERNTKVMEPVTNERNS